MVFWACCFYSVLFYKIYSMCYNIDCIPLYKRVYVFIFLLMDIQVISIFEVGWEGQLWLIHENVQEFF